MTTPSMVFPTDPWRWTGRTAPRGSSASRRRSRSCSRWAARSEPWASARPPVHHMANPRPGEPTPGSLGSQCCTCSYATSG
uniref:Uncharacterized protein n=1 Tax=Anguilla anguilla TaxID=7936 RepID=A0A0E9Q2V5_ANGAN